CKDQGTVLGPTDPVTKSSSSHLTLPSDQRASGSVCSAAGRPSASVSVNAAGSGRLPFGNGSPTVTGCGPVVPRGLVRKRGKGSARGAPWGCGAPAAGSGAEKRAERFGSAVGTIGVGSRGRGYRAQRAAPPGTGAGGAR